MTIQDAGKNILADSPSVWERVIGFGEMVEVEKTTIRIVAEGITVGNIFYVWHFHVWDYTISMFALAEGPALGIPHFAARSAIAPYQK